MVGAQGLGEDVLASIWGNLRARQRSRRLAGVSIVFLAIIIDRITQGDNQAAQQDIMAGRQ